MKNGTVILQTAVQVDESLQEQVGAREVVVDLTVYSRTPIILEADCDYQGVSYHAVYLVGGWTLL